jgi:hypothetical protein
MNILFAAVALAAAQTSPTASVDHSQHNAAQQAKQQGQHQQGQHQDHSEMMKHCHEMMVKMHKSMHEGHGGQPSGQADKHKDHQGH